MLIGDAIPLATGTRTAAAGAAVFTVTAAFTGAGGRSAFVTDPLSFAAGVVGCSWALAVNVIPTRAVMARTPMIRFIEELLGRMCVRSGGGMCARPPLDGSFRPPPIPHRIGIQGRFHQPFSRDDRRLHRAALANSITAAGPFP